MLSSIVDRPLVAKFRAGSRRNARLLPPFPPTHARGQPQSRLGYSVERTLCTLDEQRIRWLTLTGRLER
jgi:hypothetical protein